MLMIKKTVVDEHGTQLTKPKAQKAARDHIMEVVMEAFDAGHQSVEINFSALVGDTPDVTLDDILQRGRV